MKIYQTKMVIVRTWDRITILLNKLYSISFRGGWVFEFLHGAVSEKAISETQNNYLKPDWSNDIVLLMQGKATLVCDCLTVTVHSFPLPITMHIVLFYNSFACCKERMSEVQQASRNKLKSRT